MQPNCIHPTWGGAGKGRGGFPVVMDALWDTCFSRYYGNGTSAAGSSNAPMVEEAQEGSLDDSAARGHRGLDDADSARGQPTQRKSSAETGGCWSGVGGLR